MKDMNNDPIEANAAAQKNAPGTNKTQMLEFGNLRMSVSAFEIIAENINNPPKPKVGPFYYYNDEIIAPKLFMNDVDTETQSRGLPEIESGAGEHRDMWDKYMTVFYPELKTDYNDDHKALPRGRVDYYVENGNLVFWITLDKCIKCDKFTIKQAFNINFYRTEFHYGTMNYQCKDCR